MLLKYNGKCLDKKNPSKLGIFIQSVFKYSLSIFNSFKTYLNFRNTFRKTEHGISNIKSVV